MKFIEKEMVQLDVDLTTPEDAIRRAGELLLQAGTIEKEYIEAMINSYHKNGPYFVLAPGLAMPHARPEDGVKEASVSFLRLKNPIKFGHANNDPVQLIFALGAASSDEHVQVLQKVILLLNNPDNFEKLKTINDYNELKTMFKEEV